MKDDTKDDMKDDMKEQKNNPNAYTIDMSCEPFTYSQVIIDCFYLSAATFGLSFSAVLGYRCATRFASTVT